MNHRLYEHLTLFLCHSFCIFNAISTKSLPLSASISETRIPFGIDFSQPLASCAFRCLADIPVEELSEFCHKLMIPVASGRFLPHLVCEEFSRTYCLVHSQELLPKFANVMLALEVCFLFVF